MKNNAFINARVEEILKVLEARDVTIGDHTISIRLVEEV